MVGETIGLSISLLILYGIISIARVFKSEEKNKNAAASAETRYRILFDQSPDGVLLFNAKGDIVDFNEAANQQMGYTREEFRKLRLSDINPMDSHEKIKARLDLATREEKAEFEVQTQD